MNMRIIRGSKATTLAVIVLSLATLLVSPLARSFTSFTVDQSGTSLTGKFWNPNESGWGVDVVQQYGTVIVTVLTYDNYGNSIRYFASNCIVSGNGCTSDLYRVTGGVPLTWPWNGSNLVQAKIGAINLAFTDIDNAVLTGTIDGVPWTKVVKRMIFATAPTPAPTCPAPALYNTNLKACLYPIGAKVVGMNQLTSYTIGDTAWQQAVSDGTVKFIDSGFVLTGYSPRPIVWAFYKGWTGSSCTRFIYKDDGAGVIDNQTSSETCTTGVIDWVVGTTTGIIRHYPDLNKCGQFTWNQATSRIDEPVVTCPF